eukprot:UN13997
MVQVNLEGDYGYVLMATLGIAIQCWVTAFGVSAVRYEVMSQKYVQDKLASENDEIKNTMEPESKKDVILTLETDVSPTNCPRLIGINFKSPKEPMQIIWRDWALF